MVAMTNGQRCKRIFLSLPIFGSSIEGIVDNLSTSVACEYI